jgi:hypothetical protein
MPATSLITHARTKQERQATMRAEIEQLVETAKQSIGLLRRHL